MYIEQKYLSIVSSQLSNSVASSFNGLLYVLLVITFALVTFGWVFFRSETISDAIIYLHKMIFEFNIPSSFRSLLPLVMFFYVLDWIMRKDERDSDLSELVNSITEGSIKQNIISYLKMKK